MTIRTTTAALVAALVCASALATASASAAETDDDIILENEHVRVWFLDGRPTLLVFPGGAPADDIEAAAYTYRFVDLVEYNDLNGDGAPSAGEIVASLDLQKATWNVTRESGEGVETVLLALVAPVKLGRDVQTPLDELALPTGARMANVTLAFHLHEGASTVTTPEGEIPLPATAIAHEIDVHAWPFVNADVHRLALEIDIDRPVEVEGDHATIVDNATAIGEIAWAATAVGNTTAGAQVPVPVRVVATNTTEDDVRLAFTYDAAGLAGLGHDATSGIPPTPAALEPLGSPGEGGIRSEVPSPTALLAILAVAATALVLRRR